MDKETLSNYGWIVICVLVLAVMLALATPFGNFISTAVKSTTQGLFDTNKNALNSTGLINIGDQSFSDGTGGSDGGNQTTEVKREAGSVIPDGAKYTIKATNTVLEGNDTNTFPNTPQTGDMYEEGDYIYKYNQYCEWGWKTNESQDGWGVAVNNSSKTTYSEIISEIAGQSINTMSFAFSGCSNLTTAPTIPNSVTNMKETFSRCRSLTTAPTIPNGVTNLKSTFEYCTSLTTAPAIPSSVTSMTYTFDGCTSLTTAPVIPNSVTQMLYTFSGCTSLTTAPTIPNSVKSMTYTFKDCTSLITAPDMSNANSVTGMYYAFQNCTSLTAAPTIPNSVTSMNYTFYGCISLTTAPTIPSSVKYMDSTFDGCTSLTGTIEINANPSNYTECLTNTQITAVTGSTTLKTEILATK